LTVVSTTTVAPTTVAPTTVAPTTVASSIVTPTTHAPTAVAPAIIASVTATPVTATPVTITPVTITPATAASATVASATAALTALALTTSPVDDNEENPFLGVSSQGLDDDHNSAGWASSESELGAPPQNRKEARDVKNFFSLERGSWRCKYCRYVFFCLFAMCFPL
jgi:hypothetical protein